MIDKVLSAKDAYMLNMISVSIVIIFFSAESFCMDRITL